MNVVGDSGYWKCWIQPALRRERIRGFQRYTVRIGNGTIGLFTLFDVEQIWKKISDKER